LLGIGLGDHVATARDHHGPLRLARQRRRGLGDERLPRLRVGIAARLVGAMQRVDQRDARPRLHRFDLVIDIREQRDPRQRVRGGLAPVERLRGAAIVDDERASGVSDRQPDHQRADQLLDARRVLVARELVALLVRDHVGELRRQHPRGRQHRGDLVEDRRGIEAVHGDALARLQPLRRAHVRVELGLLAVPVRRRLRMLEQPIDELRILDRADITVGQREREPLGQLHLATTTRRFLELVEGTPEIRHAHGGELTISCRRASAR
jgi:hypothetical protein